MRLYLREMGAVELLSREGEIAIAKRIEAGREMMIGGICESPMTIRAIVEWHDLFQIVDTIPLFATVPRTVHVAFALGGVDIGVGGEVQRPLALCVAEPNASRRLDSLVRDRSGVDPANRL